MTPSEIQLDYSITNMGFIELPHLTNLFHMGIGEYGLPFNLTNSRFNELTCDSVRVR